MHKEEIEMRRRKIRDMSYTKEKTKMWGDLEEKNERGDPRA